MDQGVGEIDIVVTREHVITQGWSALCHEVAAMREACGSMHLEATLATWDLGALGNVHAASMRAMQAGTGFIKALIGKGRVDATLLVGLMIRASRDGREATGYKVGLKPAGGTKSAKDLLAWQVLRTRSWAVPGWSAISSASAPRPC